MNIEFFLSEAGGVDLWYSKGLTSKEQLRSQITQPLLGIIEPDRPSHHTLAVTNTVYQNQQYIAVTLCLQEKVRNRKVPFRWTAVIGQKEFIEAGANPFALARQLFSRQILTRRHGRGEVFQPDTAVLDFSRADHMPDTEFIDQHTGSRKLVCEYLAAFIAGVAAPLIITSCRQDERWIHPHPYYEYKPNISEKILEEIILCLPYQTCSTTSLTTHLNIFDENKIFDLAISTGSPDINSALQTVVNQAAESNRRDIERILKEYVHPLFNALENGNEAEVRELRKTYKFGREYTSTVKNSYEMPDHRKDDFIAPVFRNENPNGSVPKRVNRGGMKKIPIMILGIIIIVMLGMLWSKNRKIDKLTLKYNEDLAQKLTQEEWENEYLKKNKEEWKNQYLKKNKEVWINDYYEKDKAKWKNQYLEQNREKLKNEYFEQNREKLKNEYFEQNGNRLKDEYLSQHKDKWRNQSDNERIWEQQQLVNDLENKNKELRNWILEYPSRVNNATENSKTSLCRIRNRKIRVNKSEIEEKIEDSKNSFGVINESILASSIVELINSKLKLRCTWVNCIDNKRLDQEIQEMGKEDKKFIYSDK